MFVVELFTIKHYRTNVKNLSDEKGGSDDVRLGDEEDLETVIVVELVSC